MRYDRLALIVRAVYKSRMILQFDAGTEYEVGPKGLNVTRVKSGEKDYSKMGKLGKRSM